MAYLFTTYYQNRRYRKSCNILEINHLISCFSILCLSGGELLELRLLDTHLLDTFGSKTIARHEIDKLLESSKADSNRRGKYCKLLESGFN